MDTWDTCIKEAFEDAGIEATQEQKSLVASWVCGEHENYGMSHGHDDIPNPLETRLADERVKFEARIAELELDIHKHDSERADAFERGSHCGYDEGHEAAIAEMNQ